MLWLMFAVWLTALVSLRNQRYSAAYGYTQGPHIRSLHVISDIKVRYATTIVSSRVVNPDNLPGETSFIVTLPDTAYISDFVMEDNGIVYKSHMTKRDKYDRAVEAGQSAGTVALDTRASNQFTVTVNIQPEGKVHFNLTYEQVLIRKLGVYSHIISLSPKQIVEDMSVTVHIEEPATITHLEVSEMQAPGAVIQGIKNRVALAKIKDLSPQKKDIIWQPTADQQKELGSEGFRGQFVINYDVYRENISQQMMVDNEYFVNFFAPEDLIQLEKHIVFVLDFSGSMSGVKLAQLKDAMRKIMSDLQPTDYFSIVFFSDNALVWSRNKELLSVSEMNLFRENLFIVESTPQAVADFLDYLEDYTVTGSTNILAGLRTGLRLIDLASSLWTSKPNAPLPIIVFLTDGLPNEEEKDPDVIVRTVTILNTKRSPIYSLGFGHDVDSDFLRKLSLSNNGEPQAINEASDATIQLVNFYKSISKPLLSNITFDYLPDQVESKSITQKNFPIFTKGSELVVCGKLRKQRTVNKQGCVGWITGIAGQQIYKCPITIMKRLKGIKRHRRSTSGEQKSLMEKMWAQVKIKQLLEEAEILNEGEEKNEMLDNAADLALSYSFATPVTGIVIQRPDQDVTVDIVPVKAGLWSFSDGDGIDLVEQPTVTMTWNDTYVLEDEDLESNGVLPVIGHVNLYRFYVVVPVLQAIASVLFREYLF